MYKSRLQQWKVYKYRRNGLPACTPKLSLRPRSAPHCKENIAGKLVIRPLQLSRRRPERPKLRERSGTGLLENFDPSRSSVALSAPHLTWIAPPDKFKFTERYLWNTDAYYKGSVELGTWVAPSLTRLCYSTKVNSSSSSINLYTSVITAYGLFQVGDMDGTRRALAFTSACITPFVKDEEPAAWAYLCTLLFWLNRYGWEEVAQVIFSQCSEIAKLTYPIHHPLRQLFGSLTAINPVDAQYNNALAWSRVIDVLGMVLGPLQWTTLVASLLFCLYCPSAIGQGNKALTIKDLVQTVEQSCSYLDPRILLARSCFVHQLCKDGHYAKAIKQCGLLSSQLDQLMVNEENLDFSRRARLSVTQTMAFCYEALRNGTEAIYYSKEASNLTLLLYGGSDPRSIRSLVKLESTLNNFGSYVAAHEVRVRRLQAESELYSQLDGYATDMKPWKEIKAALSKVGGELGNEKIVVSAGQKKSELGEPADFGVADQREDVCFNDAEPAENNFFPETTLTEPPDFALYDPLMLLNYACESGELAVVGAY